MNDDGHHHHESDEHSALSETALRVKALICCWGEEGSVAAAAPAAPGDADENKRGPRSGAGGGAGAGPNPAYKARLLADASAAIAELGYGGRQGEHMVVVENTPQV